MKEEMISYYDLLTIIKDIDNEKDYPKVYWHNNYRDKVLYIPTFDIVSHQLEGYYLKNKNLENEDIRYWLSECMLESSMFDKCLEILEEQKKIPEKLENEKEFYAYTRYEENKNEIDKVLYILKAINLAEEKIDNLNNSINSIIDYLESKRE